MRTMFGLAAIATLLTVPAGAAPRPKADPKADAAADLKRLQGAWVYVSQTIGGRPIDHAGLLVEVDGDLLTKSGSLRYKVALDPSASPKAVDLVSHEHPSGKTFTQKGIYEWDGEALRMCFDNSGAERPKEFKAPASRDNIYLSVLKRRDK